MSSPSAPGTPGVIGVRIYYQIILPGQKPVDKSLTMNAPKGTHLLDILYAGTLAARRQADERYEVRRMFGHVANVSIYQVIEGGLEQPTVTY